MAQRGYTDADLQQVVDLIEECLKEGFAPPDVGGAKKAVTEAARRAIERGVVKNLSTFRTRYYAAEAQGYVANWTLYRPAQYQRPARSRVNAPPPHVQIDERTHQEEGSPKTWVWIGDTHDDPRIQDKSRFKVLGRFVRDMEPDGVGQIGDFATFDSVSRHEDRSSLSGRALPSFEDDIASLRMALMAFDEGLGDWEGEKACTLGNHEDRVRQYENQRAELEGGMYLRVLEAFEQRGWVTRPFGEYFFVEGVGFTHVPLNEMGKPYGGKTALTRLANDSVFSIVFGHTHKGGVHRAPKLGPNRDLTILNLGCALPEGHVEDYCRMSTTGWQYGAYVIRLHAGRTLDFKHHSMRELADLYSDAGGDVAG